MGCSASLLQSAKGLPQADELRSRIMYRLVACCSLATRVQTATAVATVADL